jgi:hypothetical protein
MIRGKRTCPLRAQVVRGRVPGQRGTGAVLAKYGDDRRKATWGAETTAGPLYAAHELAHAIGLALVDPPLGSMPYQHLMGDITSDYLTPEEVKKLRAGARIWEPSSGGRP